MEELRSYIESRRGQGVDDKQIKQELLDAGWDDAALGSFLGEISVPKPINDHLLMSAELNVDDKREAGFGSVIDSESSKLETGKEDIRKRGSENQLAGRSLGGSFQLNKSGEVSKDDFNKPSDKSDADFGDVNLSAVYVEPKKGSKKVMFLGFSILVILLLIGSLIGGSIATVYGSWKPWGMSGELRRKLVVLMANVPFAPKTTEQVLLSALKSSQEITRYNMDFSVAASVGEVGTETAKVDFGVKGPIDINDAANPLFDLDMEVGVNAAGTLYKVGALVKKSNDKKIYVKLESISDSIWDTVSAFVGSGNRDPQIVEQYKQMFEPLFKNWILYDLSDLDTDARRAMDEHNTETEANVRAMEMFDDLINRPQVRKEFELVGKEDVYGFKAYHVSWKPSDVTIQMLMSEYLKSESAAEFNRSVDKDLDQFVKVVDSMNLDFWFREDDFLMTKVSAVMKMDFSNVSDELSYGDLGMMDSLGGGFGRMSVAYSLAMEPLDEPLVVSMPENVLTLPELMGKVNGNMGISENLDIESKYQNNIDTHRRDNIYQLANLIYQYTVENDGVFPVGIPTGEANKKMLGTARGNVDLSRDLVPMYMSEMPYDPVEGSPEATGYWIYLKSDGRIVLEADSVVDPSRKITVTR